MIIKKIELISLRLPMSIVFKTSFGTIDYRPALLVKITDAEDYSGWGESSLLDEPISEHETTAGAIKLFTRRVIPKLLSCQIDSVQELHSLFEKEFVRDPVTMTGVESALWHLISVRTGQSLKKLFGGQRRNIPIGMSIGIQPTRQDLFCSIQKALRQGFGRIKIKIEPGYDLAVLRDVRGRFPDINLSVDANAAYNRKHLPIFLDMDQYHLTMIEQPFAKEDLRLHAELQKQIKTPVCLDESAFDLASTRLAIRMKSCRVVNIKPARVGGYGQAIAIHNLCQRNHIPCWVGGRLETGLGSILNLALASLSNFTLHSEILPVESFLKTDILDKRIKFSHGFMRLPKLPGNRINLNKKILSKYAIYRQEFLA